LDEFELKAFGVKNAGSPIGVGSQVVEMILAVEMEYDDPAKAEALRDLFRWCLQDGQEYAPQFGYVRLPPNVAAKALAALSRGAPETATSQAGRP
jgi:hypothetical protein